MKALFAKKWFLMALMGAEILAAAGVVSGVALGTRGTKAVAEETSLNENESETAKEMGILPLEETEIEVLSVKANVEDLEMNVGETYDLQIETDPVNAPVSYKYSIGNIVSVDEKGVVTAENPGRTYIRILAGDKDFGVRVNVLSPMKSFSFTEEEVTVGAIGEVIPLEVKYEPENTTDPKDVTYVSSDEEVAAFNEEGKLISTGLGETTITATCNDFTATCLVKVFIPIESIAFSFNQLNVNCGDSVQIPIFYNPVEASGIEDTVWESSNPAAVTVSDTGVITAVGPGTAIITATNGELTATASITAIIPVTGVAISTGGVTLNKGEAVQISASVVPGNTTESPFINWSSDNTSVATVDGNGVITATGAGTCTVTAAHNEFYASCVVTVYSPMTGIQMDQGALSVVEGYGGNLSVTCFPEDTTSDKTMTWTTDNADVATVDASGRVTGVTVGTCNVTASCNGFTTTIQVTVAPYVPVNAISLSHSGLTFETVGNTAQLSASLDPADATNIGMVWTSSNTLVATVSETGLVTAKGSGDCVITATLGEVSASCNVHVAAKNKVVVLDPGHNASFTGASYGGYREEIINLKVAMATKAHLEANYAGVTVYLTRSDGSALGGTLGADLEARAQFAQNVGADILVSQHFNASNAHTASGALVFVSNKPNVATQCNQLGGQILARICGTTGLQNRGCVATASDSYFDEFGNPMDYYAINRHSANRGIPGIIVEHCFMDVDTAFLADNWLSTFGVCDAEGIAAYLGLPHR